MQVGYAQWNPVLGDPAANRDAVKRLVEKAAGTDLLVLPELSSSGYNFQGRAEAWEASESAATGPFVSLLTRLAAKHGMHLVSGLCERDGDRLYNSAVVVGPEGVIGLYRKVHLFLNEKDIFTPGDLGFPVFDLKIGGTGAGGPVTGCRIGVLICFDWQFPEVWRVLALRGAEVVCHPSNLVLPGRAQRAVPVHAMLNRVYTVLANRIGIERGLEFTGNSLIIGPSGDVIVSGSEQEEEVRTAEIDPAEARSKAVTARNDLIADRRPEFYGDLVKPVPASEAQGAGPERCQDDPVEHPRARRA